MNKYKEKNVSCTSKIGVKLPVLLADKKYYQLLVGDRWNNFRKELFDACDECVKPKAGHTTWKGRFLYPERIPANGHDYITKVMEENLATMLQKQYDFLLDKIQYKENAIVKNQKDIEEYTNRLEESKKAVELYKNQYNGQKEKVQ